MKYLLLITAIIGFLVSSLRAAEESKAGTFSADWLEKGCLAIVVSAKDPSNTSKPQVALAKDVTVWLNGFFVGSNGMMFATEGTENKELFFPPDEWLDANHTAPLLLEYIRKHEKEIKPEMAARIVMLSWYLTSHPNASKYNKWNGENLLSHPPTTPLRHMAEPRLPSSSR